jgi:hypothetical protein
VEEEALASRRWVKTCLHAY